MSGFRTFKPQNYKPTYLKILFLNVGFPALIVVSVFYQLINLNEYRWQLVALCRSSVLTVCGIRLNTRRSSSVMRSVSIGWRWPGTAETQATHLPMHRLRTGLLTEECSVLRTTTTTSGLVAAAQGKVDGGMESAARAPSPEMCLALGRRSVLRQMWKPVAFWWNSSSKPAGWRVSTQRTLQTLCIVYTWTCYSQALFYLC